jgi:hypothetical protein
MNKKKETAFDYIGYRCEDLDYFAEEILDFKNDIKKGKFNIKKLTEIRRDILSNSKDIKGFLEEIRKDFDKSTTH